MPDSPSLIPWLPQRPFSGCETHTRLPCGYLFTGLLQKLFSSLAVLSPLSTDTLISVGVLLNPISTSPFILLLTVWPYPCRWTYLHMHSGWSRFCCAPGCCKKELSRRHPAAATPPGHRTPLGARSKWAAGGYLFPAPPFPVSQGPIAVASRICTAPVMGKRARRPGDRWLQGARIALPPPEQIPPGLQSNCCELQVASRNRLSKGGSRPNNLIFVSIVHNGPLRSNLHVQVAQSPFLPHRSPARTLHRLLLLHQLSCLCWDVVQVIWGLILRNGTALICSFSKGHAIHMEILWSCSQRAQIEFPLILNHHTQLLAFALKAFQVYLHSPCDKIQGEIPPSRRCPILPHT